MKNHDLKPSLEIPMMSLPVLLQVLQPMLQSTPWTMTQTTGESDPIRGQLKAQSSQKSCNRGHQRYKGGPTKGLPMATLYQSLESSPIRGQLRVQSSQCCNRGHHRHESSPIEWGLLRSCLGGSKTS